MDLALAPVLLYGWGMNAINRAQQVGRRVRANGFDATIVPGTKRWVTGGFVVDVIVDDPRTTATYCTVPTANVEGM
jgi:hypothetical protein